MKAQTYNKIAKQYDGHYTTPENIRENNELAVMLGLLITPETTVLDIGCGTGLLLDLVHIDPENYTGVDPSKAMLAEFKKKHPEHKTIQGNYEDLMLDRADVAVALFSGQYIPDEAKERLPHQGLRYLYMFYKPDYAPDWYYTPDEQEEVKHFTDYTKLGGLFTLTEWGNYLIAYKQ